MHECEHCELTLLRIMHYTLCTAMHSFSLKNQIQTMEKKEIYPDRYKETSVKFLVQHKSDIKNSYPAIYKLYSYLLFQIKQSKSQTAFL